VPAAAVLNRGVRLDPASGSAAAGYGAGVTDSAAAPTREELDRWLQLEGLDNARDVGGLPLVGGGTTRPGVLLRSASLHFLTAADVQHLVDVFGLRLVLDLRTRREIDRDGPTPVAGAGVETVALSFIPEDGRALPETGDDTDPLLRSYLGYLVDRTENVVEAVRRLAQPEAGPSLVHCAAGKDRTGVLVALVLDAVGVEREAVIADYALSAQQVEAMWRRWTTAAGSEMPADLTPHLPRAEVIAAVLARLDEQHGDGGRGGAAGWLLANGLEPEALDRLRARLTGRD
jgi:protein-tyrosine phosphatase